MDKRDPEAFAWLEENELAYGIWEKRYRSNNESFSCWLERVSGGDQDLKDFIKRKLFLPGGRVLSNRGLCSTQVKRSYFNCYSYGYVEDDFEAIMEAAKQIGITFKYQGGQGISLSKLRPKGSPIGQFDTSDGIIPFMKIYNEVTSGVSQGGSRRGALMMSLDVRHKEAIEFIKLKSSEDAITKANLSLEVDDVFMRAIHTYLTTGERLILTESRVYGNHPVSYEIVPADVFDALVDNCYDWGDPACLFVDRFRNYNMMQYLDEYQIETCNPCGEQPLPKHGACCLGSLNLSEFVRNPYTQEAFFDFDLFKQGVEIAVRALDALIDENAPNHPLPEQRELSQKYRNIGVGVFGYATMLMKLGLTYGDAEAIQFTDTLFRLMFRFAVLESNRLATELGAFPGYRDLVLDSDIIKSHFSFKERSELRQNGLRNCSLLSIAPTGTISNLLGESGGCEPEFAISYKRRAMIESQEGKEYDVCCRAAREYKEIYPDRPLPKCFVCSEEIDPMDRIITQSTMQAHVDAAISSTVNLPESATKEEIAEIYLSAWKQGIKGITIFRNGCKRLGILTKTEERDQSTKEEEKPKEKPVYETMKSSDLPRGFVEDVPEGLTYRKYKICTGCGKLYLFVGIDESENKIYDCFTNTDGVGGCAVNTQANSRLLSACIRGGVPLSYVLCQMQKSGTCPSFQYHRGKGEPLSQGRSCPSAIAYILSEILTEFENEKAEELRDYDESGFYGESEYEDLDEAAQSPESEKIVEEPIEHCPECGSKLRFQSGCAVCCGDETHPGCGWGRCN